MKPLWNTNKPSFEILLYCNICDVLRDFASLVQFKKRERHPWSSVTNTPPGVCYFTKSNTPPCVFFTFFKLYKWYEIAQRTTYTCETIQCQILRLK